MRALVLVLAGLLLAPSAVAHEGQDDCGAGRDAPFPVFQGILLVAPVDCVAHMGGSDDERDSYRVEAPPGTRLRVEVIPLVAGHFPSLGLFTPDHDGSGSSRLVDRNDLTRRHVTAFSVEPGAWGFYVYLFENASSGRIAHADYRLVVTLEGEPWTPDAHEGRFEVGTPAGSRIDRALGPGAPPELDGLDGDWVPLARPTTGADFVQVDAEGCEECLFVAYRLQSGSVVDATCQRNGPSAYCLPFGGVTHVLVHSSSGTGITFSARHWHAP